MQFTKTTMVSTVFAASALAMSAQADTVRVGVLTPMSGPFADYGQQFSQAIEAYQRQHGTSVNGDEIEFIYKDISGPNPARARSLAQELIVRDKVDYLAGFVFTPNALAVAPLINQARVPTVIFNAATSAITAQSDYFVRTSYTLPQVSVPVARYARDSGIEKVVTMVTDYGPGVDAETSFVEEFEALGGTVSNTIRMPLATTDFGPYLQSARTDNPDAIYTFLPGGPPTYSFVKAFSDNGMKDGGITFLGTAETQELDLQTLGDAALGLVTGFHYSENHQSPENAAFVETLKSIDEEAVANWASVGAYDGAHVIYEMVRAVGADGNGKAAVDAVRGLSWESPRGPITIHEDYRSPVQHVYMRRVEKTEDGKLVNREFDNYESQPDHGWKQ